MGRGTIPMLAVLYTAGCIAAYNENTVNVVLIDIMGAFGVSSSEAQWLVTGYMIVTACVVSAMAFLYKRFSVRALVVAGALFLIAGCIGCALSPAFGLLLAFRLLQGVGTGIFIPVMMTTVLMVAPKMRLGTYLSIGSCCITFGPALAPVVSGLMATAFGWRFVFAFPAAVMVLVIVGALAFVKPVNEPAPAALDVPSLILSVLGLVGLVFGLNALTSTPVPALCALALGVAFLAAFVHRQRTCENPILDLSPFRKRSFSFGCLLTVFAMMTSFSMSVTLVMYYEAAFGMTALEAGALLLPPILVNAATAVLAGRIMDLHGPRPLIPVGYACIAAAQLAIAFAAQEALFWPVLVASAVVYGAVGFVFAPSQTFALGTLDRESHASGVSLVNLAVQVAACLGPALYVGVMESASQACAAAGSGAADAQAGGYAVAMAVAACVACAAAAIALVATRRAR